MNTVSVYFSLGSNLGDRKHNLETAISLMDQVFSSPAVAVSDLIETPAMGFSGEDFLNCAALYNIEIQYNNPLDDAMEILRKVKEIERSLGRIGGAEYDSEGKRIYHSRTIDIDILFYGTHSMEIPQLTIPHIGIKDRPFVMIPLSQIVEPFIKDSFREIFD